jgi:5-methylcytosine-specific restriction enzyme A
MIKDPEETARARTRGPQATLRPCASQPCPELVVRGRCTRHAKQAGYTERTAIGHRERAFYKTTVWRKTRTVFLAAFPFCAICERAGRLTVATEVDHVQAIRQGGDRLEWPNLQALCKPCHSAKTRKETA